jgi:hypothetical protein
MFGLHLSPSLRHPRRPWMLLSRFTSQHSHLVLDTAHHVVTALGCSDGFLEPALKCRYHLSQVPHSPPPSWLQQSWGYFTSAPLDNVVRVTTCQTGSGNTASIIGLLLEYVDGLRNCVGQYRHDGILRALDVGDAPVLRLGFSRRPGCYHHVAEVSVDTSSSDVDSWLELPWRGHLDWWVGPVQVKIHHDGQESPCSIG